MVQGEMQYHACKDTDMVMIYHHMNSSEILRPEYVYIVQYQADITCMHKWISCVSRNLTTIWNIVFGVW